MSRSGEYRLKRDRVALVHLVRTLNFNMSEMGSHGRGILSREVSHLNQGFQAITLASEQTIERSRETLGAIGQFKPVILVVGSEQ